MPNDLPPDIIPRTRQLILPLVEGEQDREDLLTEAFFLYDPKLFGMDRAGSPKSFCIRVITNLIEYGCLPDGEHSLARLLETVRYDCGVDKHPEIDQLAGIVNALCAEKPAPLPSPPMPAEPVTAPPQSINTPRDQRTPTVFISYSSADREFALKLIKDLNAAGFACWIDNSAIKGGDDWIASINDGLIQSYAMVSLVSEAANKSRWVRREFIWADQNHRPVFPVWIEDCALPFYFGDKQAIPLYTDYATNVQQLIAALPRPKLPDVEVEDDDPVRTGPALSDTPTPPKDTLRKLELAYLKRLQLEELLNTEKYTELGGTSQINQQAEMRPLFELIPMTDDDRQAQQTETHQFENAVEEILHIQRCVLLGEPGGGKSTTIWKLAADLVDTALKDRAAPIPILIRLGKWTDADQSLADFIAEELGPLGDHLDVLLEQKRAALLLDGLNEMPASQHKIKYRAVQQCVDAHPDLLAVVSCRELDYTIDLGFDKINITPLDPLRIREFAGRYLGEERGDALFWKLAGESAVDYHQRIMNDMMTDGVDEDTLERIFWLENAVPQAMQRQYSSGKRYEPYRWQDWLKEREKPSGLMILARNPYMLLMLTSVYAAEGDLPDNRGQLFAKFVDTLIEREGIPDEEQDPLLDKLAILALEMQTLRGDAEDENTAAVVSIPREVALRFMDERQLYLGGSANILNVGDEVRFSHQLLQEYFTARRLQRLIFEDNVLTDYPQRMKATEIWHPDRWWERTNWEEAAILLAGLYSDDPTPVVEWLMAAQPEVAAQCITRSGATTPPDATLIKLRAAWIPRLTDLENDPDPQARAAVGRALGQLTLSNGEPLDNRKGVSIIVRDAVKLPDIDWVHISGGEFIYQKDERLTLPAFEISRYPVTMAQFQCFADAPDYDDDRWWAGMPDEEKVFGSLYKTRELSEQHFQFWNHPRESVNWYQAVAFCRWLSHRLCGGYGADAVDSWLVRLPTEVEWERAARGTNGREYPWGENYKIGYANIDETAFSVSDKNSKFALMRTTAVGLYPQAKSLDEIQDMSGNVSEWSLGNHLKSRVPIILEDLLTNVNRALCGGSFAANRFDARTISRHYDYPHKSDRDWGFRIVRRPR